MNKLKNSKHFNLEDRTLSSSKNVTSICKKLKLNTITRPLINQLVRSSTSIGTNYREVNDLLGKKNFIHRLRISRKEAKETIFWLELLNVANPSFPLN